MSDMMFIMIVGGKGEIMKEKDATWKGIEKLIEDIQADCDSAESYVNDAGTYSRLATTSLIKLKELLKIRKEYEGQSIESTSIDSMQASINSLNNHLQRIKKETNNGNAS